MSRATIRGSGRSPNQKTKVEHNWAAMVNKKGPAKCGIPSQRPRLSPGAIRFGPITAPKVVAQTTSDKSLPFGFPVGMSAAAKRACSDTAEPAPKNNSATISTGNDCV